MSVFLSMKNHWITAKGDRSFWTARQALSRHRRKSAPFALTAIFIRGSFVRY
jgi:hypothetical protein